MPVNSKAKPDDHAKARVFFPDGGVFSFSDSILARDFFSKLPKDSRAVYRAEGDKNPVKESDYIEPQED